MLNVIQSLKMTLISKSQVVTLLHKYFLERTKCIIRDLNLPKETHDLNVRITISDTEKKYVLSLSQIERELISVGQRKEHKVLICGHFKATELLFRLQYVMSTT